MGALDCVNSAKITPGDSTLAITVQSSNTTLNDSRRDVESQTSRSADSKHSIWWKLAIDLPAFSIASILLVLLELSILQTHKGGFFCNDPSLSYLYTGDTVSSKIVTIGSILFPLFIILLTELLISVSVDYSHSTRLRSAVYTTVWLYRGYAYGLFFNLYFMEIAKFIVGSPRPTFFDICQPDTLRTCNGSDYVSTFTCTSTKYSQWFIADSYRSFLSGHTSLSVYCGLFIVWYLQKRAFTWKSRTILLVPVLQLAAITFGAVCSLTRITDHRHHWYDVLAGAVLALFCVLYVALVLCKNFPTFNGIKPDNQPSEQTSLYNERQRITLP